MLESQNVVIKHFPSRSATILQGPIVNEIARALGVQVADHQKLGETETWRLDLPNGPLKMSTYYKGPFAKRTGILVPDYVSFHNDSAPIAGSKRHHHLLGLAGVAWGAGFVRFVADRLNQAGQRSALIITSSAVVSTPR